MKTEGIAICRLVAGQRLMEGALTGFACEVCGRALQATPDTAGKLREGKLTPVCNDCGISLCERLKQQGREIHAVATPEVMRATASPLTQPAHIAFLRGLHSYYCARCSQLVADDKAAEHVCETPPKQASEEMPE